MSIRPSAKTGGVVAAMGVAVLGVLLPAFAATAAAPSSCSGHANVTCIYAGGVNHDGGSYNTLLGYRSPGVGLADISTSNRNRLSSWINTTSTGARFYYSTGGRGTCVPMYSQDMASASASNPDDNEAESHAYTRIC